MTHWKSRAAWRLEQAGRERTWALVSARAEGISIRTLATAAGLSPSRVHQLVAAAGLDALDAALGELRAAGWPAPAIAEMIGGCIVLAAFLIWETRAPHPLVDLRLFRSREFTWGATLSTIVSFARRRDLEVAPPH